MKIEGNNYYLDNKYEAPIRIEVDGKKYQFSNAASAVEALRCPSLAEEMSHLNGFAANALRKEHPEAVRKDWPSVQIDMMRSVIEAKFLQNRDLREKLIATQGEITYEPAYRNAKDTFWGVVNGQGQNNLGKILTTVRDICIEQANSIPEQLKPHTLTERINLGQQIRENDTVGGRTVRSYRSEIYFAQAVLDVNGKLKEAGKPIITTREARKLHSEYLRQLNHKNINLEVFDPTINYSSEIMDCVRTAMKDRAGDVLSAALPAGRENAYDRAVTASLHYEKKNGKFTKYPEVPLSPYDEHHSLHETFLEYGGRILYAEALKMEQKNPKASENDPLEKKYMKNFPVAYRKENKKIVAGTYQTINDARGITYIKGFMDNQDDFKKVSMNFIGLENRITPEMQEKSRNIIETLKNHGCALTFVPGTERGQIDVQIDDTPYSVRIVDVSYKQYSQKSEWNPSMIGRVYDSKNAVSYYNTGGKASRATVGRSKIFPDIEGAELWPISYVMGWTIKDSHGNEVDTSPKLDEAKKSTNFSSSEDHTVYFENYDYGSGKPTPIGIHTSCDRATFKTKSDNIDPETGLKNAVATARARFANQIDVAGLIFQYQEHKEDPDYIPDFSSDERIGEIQSQYWDLLTGKADTLIHPGKEELYGAMDELDSSKEEGISDLNSILKSLGFDKEATFDSASMSKEEIIKAHLQEYLDTQIGNFEPDEDGIRFDPVLVTKYMDSDLSHFSRNDKVSEWLGKCGLGKEELRGENDFFKESLINRSIQFNENDCRTLSEASKDSELLSSVNDAMKKTIESSGCILKDDASIRIDNQGVIKYEGYRIVRQSLSTGDNLYHDWNDAIADYESGNPEKKLLASKVVQKVQGYVGPIFDYDKQALDRNEHVVVTHYAGSEDKAFVPHMEAYILKKEIGDTRTATERTRLIPYEKTLCDTIRQTVRGDLMSITDRTDTEVTVGRPSNIIGVYGRLYKENLPAVDYYGYYGKFGKTDEETHLLISSHETRFKYAKIYQEQAGLRAKLTYEAELEKHGEMNDNFQNVLYDNDNEAINVIPESARGSVDQNKTGLAKNQGTSRSVVQGAKVVKMGDAYGIDPARNPDGTINVNARSAVAMQEPFRYSSYDGAERQAAAFTNFDHELRIDKDVKSAQITLGGWTQDDAVVVSKDFAERNMVPYADDPSKLRPLKRGDKCSDGHSNKGVISLIVDRDMPLDEAEKLGIRDIVQLFKDNPELDYVASAYSIVSRANGGTYVEANDKNPQSLFCNGKEISNGLGSLDIHILKQTVDTKSKSENALRKTGSQSMWAVLELKCDEILQDLYKNNFRGWCDVRDLLNVLGRDMRADGTIIDHYEVQPNENKRIFRVPEADTIHAAGRKFKDDILEATKKFSSEIANAGGLMVLPFDLPLLSSETEEGTNRPKRGTGLKKSATGWVLPLMSPKLRAGTTLYDEETIDHDYTKHYEKIFSAALQYKVWDKAIETGTLPAEARIAEKEINAVKNSGNFTREEAMREVMIKKREEAYSEAKRQYLQLQKKVVEMPLNGNYKHNAFKENLMSFRQKRSATLVVSPDPRLDTDYCAISYQTAKDLGLIDKSTKKLKTDASLFIVRDPVLREGAFRCMKVKIDDSLTGIAVAPHALSSMDGDFDGDTLGCFVLDNEKAQKQANTTFSPHARMIDISENPEVVPMVKVDTGEPVLDRNGNQKELKVYPLYFKSGLDLAAGEAAKPELKEKYKQITYKANYFENLFEAQDKYAETYPEFRNDPKFISEDQRDAYRLGVMQEYDSYCHQVYASAFGRHAISYGSVSEHAESVKQTIIDGCKGSIEKEADYIEQSLGVPVNRIKDENGKIVDLKPVKDVQHVYAEGVKTGFDSNAIEQKQFATFAKTELAGDVGSISQSCFAALGITNPKAALETTQHIQQSVMQLKKSADEVYVKGGNILSCTKDFYKGLKIAKFDENGNEMSLTDRSPGTWKTVKELIPAGKDSPYYVEKPKHMTREEFSETMKNFFPDKTGMNVSINPKFADEMAQELGKKWYSQSGFTTVVHENEVRGVKEFAKTSDTTASIFPIAYGIDKLDDRLKKNGGVLQLFNKPEVKGYLPEIIRNNALAIKEGRLEDVKPLMQDDQKADYKMSYKNVFAVKNKEKPADLENSKPIADNSDFGMSM